MKVRIFCESDKVKQKFLQECLQNVRVEWVDGDDYTHAILFGHVMPLLTVDKACVVGMATEAKPVWTESFVQYVKQHVGKYVVGDRATAQTLGHPFEVRPSLVPFSRPVQEIKEKKELMSLVISDPGRFSLGWQYCNKMVELMVENNWPIHIYGHANALPYFQKKTDPVVQTDPGIQWKLQETFAPTEPFETYAFSILIEDHQSDTFYSDKPVTSLLCRCIPLHLGCKQIEEQLGPVITLFGRLDKDLHLIADILKHPDTYYHDFTVSEWNDLLSSVRLDVNVESLF